MSHKYKGSNIVLEQFNVDSSDIDDLLPLMRYWQHELRLDGWDIEMRFAVIGETEMAGTSIAGKYHQACIRLIHPSDRRESHIERQPLGYELTIVHELQHILESIWRDNPKIEAVMDSDPWIQRWHEATLDALAESLVRARRGITR